MSDEPIYPCAKEFSHVPRYWDRSNGNRCVAKLLPSQYYVTEKDELLTTLLGSCVAVCIYDTANRIGGMNHFMLPHREKNKSPIITPKSALSGRYGSDALPLLLEAMKRAGGRAEHYRVKVYGGGRIIDNLTDIGKLNIQFAEEYLAREGFTIHEKDVGDVYPRKVNFFAQTGQVVVKHLKALDGERNREVLLPSAGFQSQ